MEISKIIVNSRFSRYRKINELNLEKSQKVLKSTSIYSDTSYTSTVECAQYQMISSYDLFVLIYNYKISKSEWDKILYSRIMAVYLTELYDKLIPKIGRDLIGEIDHLADINTIKEIKEIGSQLSDLKKLSDKRGQRLVLSHSESASRVPYPLVSFDAVCVQFVLP